MKNREEELSYMLIVNISQADVVKVVDCLDSECETARATEPQSTLKGASI